MNDDLKNSAQQDQNTQDQLENIQDGEQNLEAVEQDTASSEAMQAEQALNSNESKAVDEDLQSEINALNNKLRQLMADFENYRRRTESEKAKYVTMGNLSLLMQIADIKDDISLAENDQNLNLDSAKQMLSTVKDKIAQTMAIGGLVAIQVNKGDKFDSKTMEAITTIAKPEDAEANTVADIVALGYKHAQTDEIIKTAKVVVFK